MEMSRNNDYTIGKLLDYSCLQSYYKLIRIDLSKKNKCDYSSTLFYCESVIYDLKLFLRFIERNRII